METENYIYKKEVDWSLFNYGFAIPIEFQTAFTSDVGQLVAKGEKRPVHLLMDGKEYDASITNINFNQKKYADHTDIIQIRYSPNSEIAKAFRERMTKSYSYISAIKKMRQKGDRTQIRLPEENKEYIAVYSTEHSNVFSVEIIYADDITALHKMIEGKTERIIESEFNFDVQDDTAGFRQQEKIVKIRKLNKKIGDELKKLYGYRCQICGCLVGAPYDAHICEAHHIDYFVKSLNNDAGNQMILCPNHHSIIHDRNPIFKWETLTYKYPNGFEEGLKLNEHLKNIR